uniref:Uncharacterized protein n=1 Tax=Caenorhabditis japonica TaxID=281687 RepID=A0A8R1HR70_CAEJA
MECRKGRQVPILERKKLTERAHHDISKRLNSDEEVLEDIVEEREKLENTVDKLSGPTRKKLEHVLRSIKCDSRAFFQQLTGNQARKILRPENIAKIHEVFPTNASDNLELMRDVMMDLADLMSTANNEYKTDGQLDEIETLVRRIERNLKKAQPFATVTPKLHLLSANLVPFLRLHRTWGHISEQGVEGFHPLINSLNIRFASVHNSILKAELTVKHLSNSNFLHDLGSSWFKRS